MKKKVVTLVTVALIIATTSIFFYSCRKIDEIEKQVNSQSNSNAVIMTSAGSEGCMEFAPQTRNPFSVENMDSALQELIDTGEFECDYNLFNIRPTHRYIRFEPQDSNEYDELNNDSSLILFDYPLDRRLIKGGTYYKDPSLSETQTNYQWCCVEYNHVLPNGISYTDLGDLYLPQQDPELLQYRETDFDACIFLLETQALKRTGNFDTTQVNTNYTGDDPTAKKKFKLFPPKWSPKGKITIFDDRLNRSIPLEGVRVRANKWFETRIALTNSNGFFDIGNHFNYPVDYSVKWERPDFHIKSGGFGQAYFNGPHQKGDWNLDITRSSSGGSSWLFGHVHRAAVRYFYQDIGGLRRPGQRDFRYWVFDRAGGWHNNSGSQGVNYSELARINGKKSEGGDYWAADEIFSTTIHETAHSTHLKIMNTGYLQFSQVSRIIQESYPIGVEWVITKMEYKGRGITNYSDFNYNVSASYPIRYGYQYWYHDNYLTNYTPLFIDLIDNYNQNGQVFTGLQNGQVNDAVSGYNLSEIEDMLKNVYGLSSLKTKLKANKPSGVTDSQIDNLIDGF